MKTPPPHHLSALGEEGLTIKTTLGLDVIKGTLVALSLGFHTSDFASHGWPPLHNYYTTLDGKLHGLKKEGGGGSPSITVR
ncbi:MAG: hypothetical protein QF412_00275, partial [Planctomycetota bacterium]|nr:hypothetical protein [Planctomycetota bacterium]